MTKGMVDVLCSPRVRFAQAWTTTTGEKHAYEFFLDDTVHPAEHKLDARPTCYDTNSVFAFDTERKPTPDVRKDACVGVCAGSPRRQRHHRHEMVRAYSPGNQDGHWRSNGTACAFHKLRATCCAICWAATRCASRLARHDA
jgi:hypothetical protein